MTLNEWTVRYNQQVKLNKHRMGVLRTAVDVSYQAGWDLHHLSDCHVSGSSADVYWLEVGSSLEPERASDMPGRDGTSPL